MPACPQCATTAPTTTTAPLGLCCLQVRYTCQKINGFSTWVLDVVNTACVAAANCGAAQSICTPTEYTDIIPGGCVCNVLPALPVPPCTPSCGDPPATTTAPPPTTTTPPPTTTTTTPAPTTTSTTSTTTTTAVTPCTTCAAATGHATLSNAPSGNTGADGSYPFLSFVSGGCVWTFQFVNGGITWQIKVTYSGGMFVVLYTKNGVSQSVKANAAITCTSSNFTGTITLPDGTIIAFGP
jgi:hypothetical protein